MISQRRNAITPNSTETIALKIFSGERTKLSKRRIRLGLKAAFSEVQKFREGKSDQQVLSFRERSLIVAKAT